MTSPLVSVIIPVHNTEKYIREAIESVLAQDYRPLEIIVIDDGSSDSSASIAESFPQVICIRQPNQGAGAARNTGLALCHGDFIAFLDADDLWVPHKTSWQVNYLLSHPEVDCLMGRSRNFLEPGVERPHWLPEQLLAPSRLTLAMPASLFPPRTFHRIGNFNPSYRQCEDLDWFIRLHESGAVIHTPDEVFLLRRIHTTNISYGNTTAIRNRLRIIKNLIDQKRANQPQDQGTE